jgi:hypothetical protein
MAPPRSNQYRDIDDEIEERVQLDLALWRKMRDEHDRSEDHDDLGLRIERIEKHLGLT